MYSWSISYKQHVNKTSTSQQVKVSNLRTVRIGARIFSVYNLALEGWRASNLTRRSFKRSTFLTSIRDPDIRQGPSGWYLKKHLKAHLKRSPDPLETFVPPLPRLFSYLASLLVAIPHTVQDVPFVARTFFALARL